MTTEPTAKVTPRRYADDLTVGEEIDLGGYRLEEAELLDFAGTWDPQWSASTATV